MRCVECETDPKTPGHYCECCGRALSHLSSASKAAEAVKGEAARLKAAGLEAAPTKKSSPASTSTSSNASVPEQRTRSRGLGAAAVLAAAISFGAGSYWLNMGQPPMAAVAPQAEVATDVTGSKMEAAAPADVSLPTKTPTSGSQPTPAPASPQVVTSARPSPSPGAARTRVQTKVVWPPTPPNEIASVSTPSPASDTPPPTPIAAPAPQQAAAAPRLQEPPELPQGPFFAPTDVTESPRVATRVEPQLPEGFRNRPIDEVVVVRLLVSQTGHPSRVSLLRRSKAGLPLDDAVIAAVNQWTFSPARKKGEAVSCWFNLGVPLRSNE